MPSWTLICHACKMNFKSCEIDDFKLEDFFFPPKPKFPVDGIVTTCPNCGHDGIYHAADLRYRAFAS
jgi:hypothetical protein